MKRYGILLSIGSAVLILALLLNGFPVSAGNSRSSENYAADHILVKFKTGIGAETAQMPHKNTSIVKKINSLEVHVIEIPAGTVKEQLKEYRSDSSVEYAEPDYMVEAIGTPSDAGIGNQWGLTMIQAAEAWDMTTGNADTRIAILDTGLDQDHEDLAGKIVANQNFSTSSTIDDIYGHGTHVAGVAAAITNNGVGVAGIGYNSSLMNVKVLNDDGKGYDSAVANGIVWAADNGAKVINLSLGGPDASTVMQDAINYAWSKGVVIVAAAGNNGNSNPFYPAYYDNCISVAASDEYDGKANFSDYGNWVDVAAPGTDIYSTLPNHTNNLSTIPNYGYLSGTSMAAPLVSGLAALVWSISDGIDNVTVRSLLESTADPISGTGAYWQKGRVNALRASGAQGIPKVNTSQAAEINSTGATLNGNLVDLDNLASVQVLFEYGTSPDSYTASTEPQILTQPGNFQATVTGLSPDMTYYFRARAIGNYSGYGTQDIFNTWITPPRGKIAFLSNRDGDFKLYVMNADGSDVRSFFNPPMGPFDTLDWSPDGSKLAFINLLGAPAPFPFDQDICIANDDGSNIVNLTNNKATDWGPAWSPDGTRIAFMSDRDGNDEIYVMNSDGTNVTRLTNDSDIDCNPTWSPDGQQIAFESDQDGSVQIYIMNIDGSNLRKITSLAEGVSGIDWSPDGTRFVFSSFTGYHCEIFTINVDGSDLKQLTSTSNASDGPQWSPDGKQIIYNHGYHLGGGQVNVELFIMNADGSGQHRLTDLGGYDYHAAWGRNKAVSPEITTNPATNLTSNSATLNGNLISKGTADTVQVSFQWDTSSQVNTRNYAHETAAQAMSAIGEFNVNLEGLTPNTIYYYRARAVGDGTVYGKEEAFTISAPPLAVTTLKASSTTPTSAILNGNLTVMGGNESVSVYFEWGLTTDYGHSTLNPENPQIMNKTGPFKEELNGLEANKTYHYRAVAAGKTTAYGEDVSFVAKKQSTGGGGGGGGGSSPRIYEVNTSGLTNSARLYVNKSGIVQGNVHASLEDGTIDLYIPQNSKLTSASGSFLDKLIIHKVDPLPDPPEGKSVLQAYEFGPEGAKFAPPLNLTLKYDPQTIPSGSQLETAYWDGTQWIAIDSRIDTEAGIVTSQISHFSQYALLMESPPEPTQTEVSEPPNPEKTDEPVSVQAEITSSQVDSGKSTAIVIPSPSPEAIEMPEKIISQTTPTESLKPAPAPASTVPVPEKNRSVLLFWIILILIVTVGMIAFFSYRKIKRSR